MAVLPDLQVAGSAQLTPRMRRVTIRGEALRTVGPVPPAAHVRLLFGDPGAEVTLPVAGPSGLTWPPGLPRPYARSMTVRALDAARGEMTVDVALHGDSAAGRWACAARAGDPVGVVGPGGGWTPPADARAVLLAGDEAALPAIAALHEALPADLPIDTVVELADPSDQQELARPVAWVHRDRGECLEDALRGRAVAGGVAVWVAAEGHAVKAIREHLRLGRGLARSHCHAIRYWTRGRSHEDSDATFGAARAEAARRGIDLVTTQDVHEMSYELMTGGFPIPATRG